MLGNGVLQRRAQTEEMPVRGRALSGALPRGADRRTRRLLLPLSLPVASSEGVEACVLGDTEADRAPVHPAST